MLVAPEEWAAGRCVTVKYLRRGSRESGQSSDGGEGARRAASGLVMSPVDDSPNVDAMLAVVQCKTG